jgi:hypothetical protein
VQELLQEVQKKKLLLSPRGHERKRLLEAEPVLWPALPKYAARLCELPTFCHVAHVSSIILCC